MHSTMSLSFQTYVELLLKFVYYVYISGILFSACKVINLLYICIYMCKIYIYSITQLQCIYIKATKNSRFCYLYHITNFSPYDFQGVFDIIFLPHTK